MFIMGLSKTSDGQSQVSDAGESVTIKCPPFLFSKPTFDRVQPRCAGRCEVQLEARVFRQPRFDRYDLVG